MFTNAHHICELRRKYPYSRYAVVRAMLLFEPSDFEVTRFNCIFRCFRHVIQSTFTKRLLYLGTASFMCVMWFMDVHVIHKNSIRANSKNFTTKRKINFEPRAVLNTDLFDFVNPLNNKTLKIRLSLTAEEQHDLLYRNLSFRELGLSLPIKKKLKLIDKKHTRMRNLDLLGMKNFTFNTLFKNPCWRDIHQTMNCLPYFFLIGAPKCGTTDLYQRLIKHPDIVPPAFKEPHWLTRIRTGPVKDEGIRRDPSALSVYLYNFLKTSLKMYNSSNADKITGDCSASTLWDNDIWTELPRNDNPLEPTYTNVDYVYKLNKNAKIIALLRDPVQRLYSDYLYFEDDNQLKSPAIFHNHVIKSVRLFTACMAMFSVRSCVYHPGLNNATKVRLRISMYYIHLLEWYRKFPPEQVLVLGLDDYARNTKRNLVKIFRFLDIRPLTGYQLDNIAARQRANARSDGDRSVGGMWPETRNILIQFYKPFNQRLYKLLNEKKTKTS